MNNYLTVNEAVTRSGFSREHIRYLCRAGKLRAEMPGRDWLIQSASLERYLTLGRRPGPKPNRRRRQELERKANELK